MPADVLTLTLLSHLTLPVLVLNGDLDPIVRIFPWQGDALANFEHQLVIILHEPALLLSASFEAQLWRDVATLLLIFLIFGWIINDILNTLLRLVIFFGLNMHQNSAFPIGGTLGVAVHQISRSTSEFFRATIEIFPDEEAPRLAAFSNQLLDTENEGANDRVCCNTIIVPS